MRHCWMIGMLLLLGCVDQTSIQSDYLSERDDCQSEAEDRIDDYSEGADEADIRLRNSKLVSLFSDCMFEHGWTVAAPERESGKDGPPELDARKTATSHDTSVGVGDTIKPGQVVEPPTQGHPAQPYQGQPHPAQPQPAYAPAVVPAPIPAQPTTSLPPPPPGYQYQLIPATSPPPPPPGYQYQLIPVTPWPTDAE